ncbi:MAG: hypothetical protein MUE59_02690 [Thiobacillaceae bacterium]|nr:hypothetical protein [Thiobacillaceae bacterium]
MAKQKKRPESLSAGYSAIPWAVLDGAAFQGSSPRAKAMLFEAMRQLDGRNNGHLNLALSTLRKRGWKSADAIQAAKSELLARGLVIRTKQGGLNIGPDLYAVTWLNVSNFGGLEIGPHQYHPGAWRFVENLPAPKKRHARAPEKREVSSASRNGTVPPHGTAKPSAIPPHGTKTAVFDPSAIPPHGNNVIHQSPPAVSLSAVGTFKARIGGRLTVPEREPNPLGRTRNIRLFKAAFGHLIAQAAPHPTDQPFPVMRAAGWRYIGAAPENHPRQAVSIFKPKEQP